MFRRFYQHLRTTIAGTLGLRWLPALMGFATAASVWVVRYCTKMPCTPANALDYQCDPSAIAGYIDSEVPEPLHHLGRHRRRASAGGGTQKQGRAAARTARGIA